jgi:hypothetical protein
MCFEGSLQFSIHLSHSPSQYSSVKEYLIKALFTLGVRESSVESPNTRLG